MPIYEYECDCGNRIEIKAGFDSPDGVECPECGKSAYRIISATTFTFKGGRPSQEGVSKVNPKARRVRV